MSHSVNLKPRPSRRTSTALPGGAGDQRPRGGQPLIMTPLSVEAEISPPLVAPVVAVVRPPVEAGLRPQCVVAVVPIAYIAHALA